MRLLTRSEEYVLLAVWYLQDDAYTLTIRERLNKVTGTDWSLGSIYTPLERLDKRGLVLSAFSDATPERGGRPKRLYRLTPMGKAELLAVRQVSDTLWTSVKGLALSAGGSL